MISFKQVNPVDFLTNYWQKKPLVLRQALPNFKNPLSADELAGLALEEEVESRIVLETPNNSPYWTLKRGPFIEKDFNKLPKTHWTLLVQGVDRFVPEVSDLLNHFNFLPQWRIDDIMISYAVMHGSVGPHYDNYDVFLYQAQGRRKWLLTSQHCHTDNYLDNIELRIMKHFVTEQEIILEEGDMLYLPPHIGHHGISLSDDCMTYSFGYRSYQLSEMWDSLSDFLSFNKKEEVLYTDPNWAKLQSPAEIPRQALINARQLLQAVLDDERALSQWFGSFVTSLDRHAESLLPAVDDGKEFDQFCNDLGQAESVKRNPLCRFAYMRDENASQLVLYINGEQWETSLLSPELVRKIADNHSLTLKEIMPFVDKKENQLFLYRLWQLEWLEFLIKDN
ncbi:cupin [Legionella beliardensis]|uniref:Cupin n=1 Tax=Legionella beliardensis TaxID=91822 RepID=A0A378HZG2_9GAMM|nr:cupin domain-containing protein [Legionella beliardensis]STX28328.1 cupin [Legionella beliardensis]